MDISSLSPPGSAASAATEQSAASNPTLGKEDFLRLLVTQLNNQDPLNPMDGQQFAAQLAQFTSVEQLVNIADQIAAGTELNSVLAQSMNSGVAAGLIGKHVHATSARVAWDGSASTEVGFEAAADVASATIEIVGEQGIVISSTTLSQPDFDTLRWRWDGKNKDGIKVEDGVYEVVVRAFDDAGAPVGVDTSIDGTIDRVTFTGAGIQLWISGVDVAMAAILSIEDHNQTSQDD